MRAFRAPLTTDGGPMERTTGQKLLAEFIGAFALIFIGAGSIIAGFGGGGLINVAFAYGLALATMVTALGHVSGGHFNPAVTIGAWVTQKLDGANAVRYIGAQLAGGAAAAGVLRAAIPETFWRAGNLGTPSVNASLDVGQAVLIEAVLTFFLVWVFFATAIDPDGAFAKIAGLAIGFVVVMGVLTGGTFTGAAMNPARWFGPALLSGFWTHWWVYLVGPIAGGIVAAVVYDSMILRPTEAPVQDTAPDEIPHGIGAHGAEGEHEHEHEHHGD